MFQVNDMIVYGAHGVCRIAEIEERDFNGSSIEYYILKPVYDEKATIFVPVLNDRLTAKMRRVLSKDEIEALICLLYTSSSGTSGMVPIPVQFLMRITNKSERSGIPWRKMEVDYPRPRLPSSARGSSRR